jgi:dihydropyrimidine dehydrogenase (NAD+) subunit PreA
VVARIDQDACIGCDLCRVACDDGAHQCIHLPEGAEATALNAKGTPLARVPKVDEQECIGCNLCGVVCPVQDCISMVEIGKGRPQESWNQRVAAGRGNAKSVLGLL